MKTYTISPQSISLLRKKIIKRMGIIMGIFYLSVISLVLLLTGPDNWISTLVASFIFTGVFTFSILRAAPRALKQNIQDWESFRIEVTDDYIARSQVRVPDVRINRQEITTVDEVGAGLCVRTSSKSRTL